MKPIAKPLIDRLRDIFPKDSGYAEICAEAADRLVALEGELRAAADHHRAHHALENDARVERVPVLNELIAWLDAKGAASTVCAWGAPGTTIRALIEKFRDAPNPAIAGAATTTTGPTHMNDLTDQARRQARDVESNERVPDGMARITAERQRQVEKEGFDAAHDAEHSSFELIDAAACYNSAHGPTAEQPRRWPWDACWWKPKGRIRNLERAGALYLAAAERADQEGNAERAERCRQAWVPSAAQEIDRLLALPDFGCAPKVLTKGEKT